jgi:hypothetical protein
MNLLTEIDRIRNMMGLLNENTLRSQAFRKLQRLFGGGDDFNVLIRDGIDDTARREVDDVLSRLKNNDVLGFDDWIKLFKHSNPEKLARKLFDEDILFTQNTITTNLDNLINGLNDIDEYERAVESLMSNKDTFFGVLDNSIDELNGLTDEYAYLIEQQLRNRLKELKPDWYNILFSFNAKYQRLSKVLNDVVKGLGLEDVRTMFRVGKDAMFKNADVLKDEFMTLSEMAVKAYRAGDEEAYKRLSNQMRDKLLAINKNGVMTMYEGSIRDTLSVEARKVFEKDEEGWKYLLKTLSDNPTTNNGVRDYMSNWKKLVFPISKDKHILSFLLDIEWWQRVVNTIVLQNPVTFNESVALLARRGFPKGGGLVKWYFKKVLLGKTIVPVILGTLKTFAGLFIFLGDLIMNAFGYDIENPWGQDNNETWFQAIAENFKGVIIDSDGLNISLWDLLGFTSVDEFISAINQFNVTTPEKLASEASVTAPEQLLPNDLKSVLSENQLEHVKYNPGEGLFWDTPEYTISKVNGVWCVLNPSDNKWYEINDSM